MSKKVSVCMISYNHENFIKQAIEEVINQETNFYIELIIGDDFSTDNTAQICKEYQEKYPQIIKLLPSTQNLGMMPNFVRTLQACKGEYIAFCEGDDYWTDTKKLQKQVDILESNSQYSGSFHHTQAISQEDNSEGKLYGIDCPNILNAEDTISAQSMFHTSSFVLRNTNISQYLEWLSKCSIGDLPLFSCVAKYGDLVKIPETMSVYRVHQNSITNSTNYVDNRWRDRLALLSQINQLHDYKYDYKVKKIKQEIIKNTGFTYLKTFNIVMNSPNQKPDAFLNPPFTEENLDRYYTRKSILAALTTSATEFSNRFLDVGCGKMPYREHIINNSSVKDYVGLDIENALQYDADMKADFTWDGITMPFEDASFESSMATEVLEHCPEPEIVLKEIYRVLKPNGIFFFTVPFLWTLHEAPHDEYRYTPWSLERHLKNSGFSHVEIKALGGWHASLAQMLGLWVRRSHITTKKKKVFSKLLKPLIEQLIKRDIRPESFGEGTMMTGLYGIAIK